MNRNEFVEKIAPDAVYYWHKSGVPASLTIAQAALESNWGNSKLTVMANNLFGIKGVGPAGSISMLTTEYSAGAALRLYDQFRKYFSWGQSIADHTELLLKKRYSKVLHQDGKAAARAVQAAGYATDPYYAFKLIDLMDRYDLYQYDRQKGDDPMTAEERKQFNELLKTVSKQSERLTKLENGAAAPTPDWARAAVAAALNYDKKNPLFRDTETGSIDFYRLLTIMHRRGLFTPSKDE